MQRQAFRPVVDDITRNVTEAVERSLEARLTAHLDAVQYAADKQRPLTGVDQKVWGRVAAGGSGRAPNGVAVGRMAGTEYLRPRGRERLLALPKRPLAALAGRNGVDAP